MITMAKEDRVDRELDSEMRSELLLGWFGTDGQLIEMREGWGKPLSCSGIIQADNDVNDDDKPLQHPISTRVPDDSSGWWCWW